MKIIDSVRESIQKISPYVAGKSAEVDGDDGQNIKLSSNESYFGISEKVAAAMKFEIDKGLNVYPDMFSNELRKTLTEYWNNMGIKITEDQLVFGDGSGELIRMISALFLEKGDKVVIPENSFLLYASQSEIMGAEIIESKRKDYFVDLSNIIHIIQSEDNVKLIYFSNPDNPTSTYVSLNDLKTFMDQVPAHISVVIDEAYIHYQGIENTALQFLNQYPNLIILFTFSKAYGLAALRVGYGVMNSEIAAEMEKIRLPFNLGSVQQAGASAAVKDSAKLTEVIDSVMYGKNYLTKMLDKLGFWYIKPAANFIFVDLGENHIMTVKHLEDQGISIRSLEHFGFNERYYRITIGKKEFNHILIKELAEATSQSDLLEGE